MMKKMVFLFALMACSLVACDKERTMNNNEEKETVSFHAEMKLFSVRPEWEDIIGSKNGERAKTGALFLVEKGTFSNIIDTYGQTLSSWKSSFDKYGLVRLLPPVDSNYFSNPNDLINLFKIGAVKSIESFYSPQGYFKNIPYGEYELLATFGLHVNDTLKAYNMFLYDLNVDGSQKEDTIDCSVNMSVAGPLYRFN